MNWEIKYSRESVKFLIKNNLKERDLDTSLSKAINKFRGKNINIDIKKMKGDWIGFYRLREGKIRIIFSIDFEMQSIYVDRIDFRGDIYK